jgi:hypothetical protein
MFNASDYRKRALDYAARAGNAITARERNQLHDLERRFRALAENEQWLADNHDKIITSDGGPEAASADDEEYILRCLGAAVIFQWNTIPAKLQRELFDTAGSMGDLPKTVDLRNRIARFLHRHNIQRRLTSE